MPTKKQLMRELEKIDGTIDEKEREEIEAKLKSKEKQTGKTTEEIVGEEKPEARPDDVDEKQKKDETILTPLEDYIKTASYLGTKVITPTMRKYVYRRRLDGLAILNTLLVDKKLKQAIDFIIQFKPNDWTLVCKREAGWRGAKMFSELTGVKTFTKKYPAGILTNTQLSNFFETKMIMICDPWMDKNALKDAKRVHTPVVGICDTNNHTKDIDIVIIANNKSNKSFGLIFWLLAREYMKAYKIDKPLPTLEDFVGEELILEEPKKKKKKEKEKQRELKSDEEKIEERMRQLAIKADAELKKEEQEEGKVVKAGEGAKEGV